MTAVGQSPSAIAITWEEGSVLIPGNSSNLSWRTKWRKKIIMVSCMQEGEAGGVRWLHAAPPGGKVRGSLHSQNIG